MDGGVGFTIVIIGNFSKAISLTVRCNDAPAAGYNAPMLDIRGVVGACVMVIATAVSAEAPPKWEIGLGLGVVSLPDYRGADVRSAYVLPLPYVSYTGERVAVDREGMRGGLFRSERVRLDFSAAAAPPAKSDSGARADMPELDPAIELGPSLVIDLGKRNGRWSLHLPLRAVVASDLTHTESIGWVFSPYLKYAVGENGAWEYDVSVGPMYASEAYHDYYYEVDPAFATAARPAYDAPRGYSGTRVTFTLGKRFDGYWLGVFARYDNLSDAAFGSSPLVETDSSLIVGGGIAWILARSAKPAPPRESSGTTP